MAFESDSPLDSLWKEYGRAFQGWDDLTLGRWLAQTLGQLEGRAWRLSHPLMGAYRLAAQIAHDRQVWFKRLATPPAAYAESPCCRAPFLPLFTRDVRESGLICQHCSETLVPFDEIPADVRAELDLWAQQYEPVHAVAHRTTASAGARAITTTPTKTRRRKPSICSRARAANSRRSCCIFIPPSSGRIRTNASKCGRRTWRYNFRFLIYDLRFVSQFGRIA